MFSRNAFILGWLRRLGASQADLPIENLAPRRLVFDNDKKYGTDVLAVIEHLGIRRKKISPYSPGQNGTAERWVATVRRDLLDHGIVLNERHLHRLLSEFVAYDHATGRTTGWARAHRR